MRARPGQLAPGRPRAADSRSAWWCWLVLAGRGWGKTLTAAQHLAHVVREVGEPGAEFAVIGRTDREAVDVAFRGPSGLLACFDRSELAGGPSLSPGRARVEHVNGSTVFVGSAHSPDALRGKNLYYAWCDELATFRDADYLWHEVLVPALRAGPDPRVVVSTTPRPRPLIRDLAADRDTVVSRGTVYDNAANLAPSVLTQLEARYAGTRVGRQELEGQLLDEAEGALWSYEQLERSRLAEVPRLARVQVGVDPSGSPEGGCTGIVVSGVTAGTVEHPQTGEACRELVTVDDRSVTGTADRWGRAVVAAWRDWDAAEVVVERNYGGDMARRVIHAVDPAVPVRLQTSHRSKQVRAEPVAALAEQGLHRLAGRFAALEDQLTGWAPGDDWSPDRLDALVFSCDGRLLELVRGRAGVSGPAASGSIRAGAAGRPGGLAGRRVR